MVFAASRWKDFTELGDIKSIFTSQFGKEFTAPAVELRNNNRVNQSVRLSVTISIFVFCFNLKVYTIFSFLFGR